VPMINSEF